MAIGGINGVNTILPSNFGVESTQENNNSTVRFTDYLNEALDKVNNLQLDAENMANEFAAGNTDNIHGVLIASEKAEIALQLTMQIRNKLMDAYNEIMRMQI